MNPYHSTYWLDLALAYYSVGDEASQQAAILKAVEVDPTTPDVAWTAANFFLAQGKVSQALQQFAVAMRGDPNLVQPSLDLCWRTMHDTRAIEAILPPVPDAYLQFLRLLVINKQSEAADQVWAAMLALTGDINSRLALFYVDALLLRPDPARANQAWEQLVSRSAALQPYRRTGSLVVDGGLEQEMLNAGFGWRYTPQTGSIVSPDRVEYHSGRRSLRIDYNGNGGDAGLLQYVLVKSNTEYVVSAWVRSQDLDSANGPWLALSDAYSNQVYATTQEILGTTPWHRLAARVQTGPQTQLLAIRIQRDPGKTVIQGKLWVDDVSLVPAPNATANGSGL